MGVGGGGGNNQNVNVNRRGQGSGLAGERAPDSIRINPRFCFSRTKLKRNPIKRPQELLTGHMGGISKRKGKKTESVLTGVARSRTERVRRGRFGPMLLINAVAKPSR